MDSNGPVTIRPPVPRIVHLCVIDADLCFCWQLEEYIREHCAGSIKLVKAYDAIPDLSEVVPAVDALIFDPRLPDFRAVDGINRVESLFGEHVTLIARLHEGMTLEDGENLEISGVKIGVAADDFKSIVDYLCEVVLADAPARSSHESHTSITPLRPQPVHITLSIIDADPNCSSYLARFFNERMPGLVLVDEALDGIPEPESIARISRAVIFDPELDDFRRLAPAIEKIRAAFGEDTLLVAHTDAWSKGSRLRSQLREAGVAVGIRRSDLMSFLKLIDLLTQQESVDTIVQELDC